MSIGPSRWNLTVARCCAAPERSARRSRCPASAIGGSLGSDGIESGVGCVYPSDVPNIGTQLTAAGLNWKAYEQDMVGAVPGETGLVTDLRSIATTPACSFITPNLCHDGHDHPCKNSSSCCGETAGPASPLPGITGPGGGVVGAVLLSPFIKKGTVSLTDYNHYSSLATFEDLFGLPLLGEAQTVTRTFGSDIFTKDTH